MDYSRTIVTGNSGSGKSWLAEELARRMSAPHIELDSIFHEAGTGFEVTRDKQLVATDVRSEAERDRWIIEGVYGWLAAIAAPRATALIWLDIPVSACLEALRGRGITGGGTQQAFDRMLGWAAEYDQRNNSNSWAGHKAVYDAFPRHKQILRQRDQIEEFLEAIPSNAS